MPACFAREDALSSAHWKPTKQSAASREVVRLQVVLFLILKLLKHGKPPRWWHMIDYYQEVAVKSASCQLMKRTSVGADSTWV